MKENITEIMNILKLGQVIKLGDKEYAFIEAKRTRAVVRDRETKKEYLIKGMVEITEEIDEETINDVEEEAINEYMHERAVRKMVRGQHFIGQDDREYVYYKFNRTTLVCTDWDTKEKYKVNPTFVKHILEKVD